MAREYARIRLSINTDADFEDLTPEGQWFYTRVVIPEPSLNHCGIFDWRPRRMLNKARGVTLDYIHQGAGDCEQGRFVLFDPETEEALARSYIRSEELLRNPKMAVAVMGSYRGIASKVLRAAVVTEIRRVKKESPDYSSWTSGDVGRQLDEIMSQKSASEVPYVDTITNPITNRITNRIGNADAVGNTNHNTNQNTNMDPGADYQSKSVPIPCSMQHATNTLQHATSGGYVTEEQNQGAPPDPNTPPPRFCDKHPNDTGRACPACGVRRRAREAWDEQHAAVAAQAKATRKVELAREISDCPDCDDIGWVETDDGVTRCPRHDWDSANA